MVAPTAEPSASRSGDSTAIQGSPPLSSSSVRGTALPARIASPMRSLVEGRGEAPGGRLRQGGGHDARPFRPGGDEGDVGAADLPDLPHPLGLVGDLEAGDQVAERGEVLHHRHRQGVVEVVPLAPDAAALPVVGGAAPRPPAAASRGPGPPPPAGRCGRSPAPGDRARWRSRTAGRCGARSAGRGWSGCRGWRRPRRDRR